MYFDCVILLLFIGPELELEFFTLFRNTLGYKIVGHPVRIDGQRYARNAYYFNLCFVCDAWARTIQYEPVVKKLSEYLVRKSIILHLRSITILIYSCRL